MYRSIWNVLFLCSLVLHVKLFVFIVCKINSCMLTFFNFKVIVSILSCVGGGAWLYDWMIGFIDTLQLDSRLQAITAISLISALSSSMLLHTLVFSVFTSNILATDFKTVSLSLQITHEDFFWQSYFFLVTSSQSLPTADSLNSTSSCSQGHILAQLNFLYNHFVWSTQKTQPLYCWEDVFTVPFHTNGSYSIVSCVFVVAGTCLPSRFLTMNVYSDFTISAFGHHVTI
jgi:hypothetical protein